MIQNKLYNRRKSSAHFDAVVPTIPGVPGVPGIKSVPGALDPYVIHVSHGTPLTIRITCGKCLALPVGRDPELSSIPGPGDILL